MKSSEIKLLEDEDFFDYDYWDEYCDDYLDFMGFESVDYSIDEMGLVDWTIVIPVSIRRLKKIESLLNPTQIDLSNKIENYWPK